MNSFGTSEATRFSEIAQGGKDLNPYVVVRFHPHSPLFLSSAGYFCVCFFSQLRMAFAASLSSSAFGAL